MSLLKEELHRLVDRLPEQNVARAKRYLERLVKSVQPESSAMSRPNDPYRLAQEMGINVDEFPFRRIKGLILEIYS